MCKRIAGYERPEYPGAYQWPIYEYKCPECGVWTKDIDGNLAIKDENDEWSPVCVECAITLNEEWADNVAERNALA